MVGTIAIGGGLLYWLRPSVEIDPVVQVIEIEQGFGQTVVPETKEELEYIARILGDYRKELNRLREVNANGNQAEVLSQRDAAGVDRGSQPPITPVRFDN